MIACKPLLDERFIRGWFDTDRVLWRELIIDYQLPPAQRTSRLIEEYQTHVAQCVNLYCQDYPEALATGAFAFETAAEIVCLKPTDDVEPWRAGRQAQARRHLVYMTYLNTVEERGWTQWKNQKIDIQPQRGLTLIWPADWTWSYRNCPATTDKYVAMGYLTLAE